jgi:hypothetical protein
MKNQLISVCCEFWVILCIAYIVVARLQLEVIISWTNMTDAHIGFLTSHAWVDWSDFSVAYWGWLEEGSFRWSKHGRYDCQLGFGFRRLSDKCLGHLVRGFFVAYWGPFSDQRCRSFKMATRQPYWILFLSIIWRMPGSTAPIFLWLIGGDWRKVPLDDQRRSSFKMAAMAASLIWFPSTTRKHDKRY